MITFLNVFFQLTMKLMNTYLSTHQLVQIPTDLPNLCVHFSNILLYLFISVFCSTCSFFLLVHFDAFLTANHKHLSVTLIYTVSTPLFIHHTLTGLYTHRPTHSSGQIFILMLFWWLGGPSEPGGIAIQLKLFSTLISTCPFQIQHAIFPAEVLHLPAIEHPFGLK